MIRAAAFRSRITRMKCAALLIILGVALIGGGCRAGRVSRANDELRQKVLQLETEVKSLTARNRELVVELEREASKPDSVPQEIRLATPHAVKLDIGRLSHARDASGDGVIDTLLIYLHPSDGRGRFTQLVGSMDVHAAVLPPQDQAVTIGQISLNAGEVRDAYRSSLTGVHYAIEMPVQVTADLAQIVDPHATVRVSYRDGYTGQTLSAERAIKLK